MKVLFVNHPAAAHFKGGDSAIIATLVEQLERLGIKVEQTTDIEPRTAGFDLVHLFNTNPVRPLLHQSRVLRRQGLPIVMTPFYHQMAFMEWAQCGSISAFAMATTRERDQTLKWLAERSYSVPHQDGRLATAFEIVPADPDYLVLQRELIGNADLILPGSHLEMSHLMRIAGVWDRPFEVVPFGLDTEFPLGDADRFEQKYGSRDFVLQVSRFDTHKNQPMLIHALRDLALPLVLVGDFFSREFVSLCQSISGGNARILPRLPLDDLRDAYAAARVHVLPSFAETCGLVTLEAALSDCNVVVSNTGCEIECFRDFADYCNPLSIDSIRDSVVRSYERYPEQAERRSRFRDWIHFQHGKQKFAERVAAVYERMVRQWAHSSSSRHSALVDPLGPGAHNPTSPYALY